MGINANVPGLSRVTSRQVPVGHSDRPVTSARADLVTSGFGVWLIVGLFTDGWAHMNLPGLETFFTPWHALLYSGFAASAAWITVLVLRNVRKGWQRSRALPVGYRLAAVGVVVFGAGGVADMAWHVLFGVEVGVDALLSPTHLVLLTGGVLVLTAALRSGWARPVDTAGPTLRSELPAVVSLGLVTALVGFFLLYVSVFEQPAAAVPFVRIPEGAPGHQASEQPVALGLAGYLVTTVLLVVPVLLAERVGRRPRGLIVIVVGMVAWLSAAVNDLSTYGVVAATLVTVGAVIAELVGAVLQRAPLPTGARLAALGAVIPLLLWTAQLAAVAATAGLGWSPALWSGAVVLSTLVGAMLGLSTGWAPTRMAGPGETTRPERPSER